MRAPEGGVGGVFWDLLLSKWRANFDPSHGSSSRFPLEPFVVKGFLKKGGGLLRAPEGGVGGVFWVLLL